MDQPAALKPTARSEGRSLGRFLRRPLGRPLGSEGAPPDGKPRDTTVAGIVYANMSVLTFTLMDAIIKDTSRQFPTGEIIFFRNLFAFIPLLLYVWLRGERLNLRTRNAWGHVMRGAFGVTSMFFLFFSYQVLPLSDAIALGLSGPIFVTVLSVPILGEQVGWRRWSAVITGFIGVVIMTRPGPGVFDIDAAWPLLGAVFYAFAMISIRRLGSSEPSSTIVFYFSAFSVLASLITIPFALFDPGFRWVMPQHFWSCVELFAVGLLGGSAQILLTKAYQRARASVVSPFDYTALVYGFILAWVFYNEVPDAFLIVGGLFVVASGVYIIHRETVVARAQHRAPPVPPLPTNE
ncbi:MAG TPA: DMT family transporter [Dongiaceae bacterium]|nr:DMT family transporter [Dongiaceae bacterium]